MIRWVKKYNIHLKIGATFTSIVLWIFVMSVINPEVTITFNSVKVTVNGATELFQRMSYSILSDTNISLDVTLRGKRNVILSLKKTDIEVICDVSQIAIDGENRIICSVVTPNADITVMNPNDMKATVVVDKIIEKNIDIKHEMLGTLEEGLSLGLPELQAITAKVKGPSTEINAISHGLISHDISELSESQLLTLPVNLIGDNGEIIELPNIQILDKTVDVFVPVYMLKEMPLKVTLNYGGGLSSDDIDVKITPSKVVLVGDKASLAEIEYLSLGMIDLDGIGDGITTEKQFVLPSGIDCLTDRTSATVELSVKDIIIKEYIIENIVIRGTNELFDVLPEEDFISIRLRGNSRLLSTVKSDDISVNINISGVEIIDEGYYIMPAIVGIKPAFNIAVIGEYEINMIASLK